MRSFPRCVFTSCRWYYENRAPVLTRCFMALLICSCVFYPRCIAGCSTRCKQDTWVEIRSGIFFFFRKTKSSFFSIYILKAWDNCSKWIHQSATEFLDYIHQKVWCTVYELFHGSVITHSTPFLLLEKLRIWNLCCTRLRNSLRNALKHCAMYS